MAISLSTECWMEEGMDLPMGEDRVALLITEV